MEGVKDAVSNTPPPQYGQFAFGHFVGDQLDTASTRDGDSLPLFFTPFLAHIRSSQLIDARRYRLANAGHAPELRFGADDRL